MQLYIIGSYIPQPLGNHISWDEGKGWVRNLHTMISYQNKYLEGTCVFERANNCVYQILKYLAASVLQYTNDCPTSFTTINDINFLL